MFMSICFSQSETTFHSLCCPWFDRFGSRSLGTSKWVCNGFQPYIPDSNLGLWLWLWLLYFLTSPAGVHYSASPVSYVGFVQMLLHPCCSWLSGYLSHHGARTGTSEEPVSISHWHWPQHSHSFWSSYNHLYKIPQVLGSQNIEQQDIETNCPSFNGALRFMALQRSLPGSSTSLHKAKHPKHKRCHQKNILYIIIFHKQKLKFHNFRIWCT